MTKYYVYGLVRQNGQICYIGKGKGRRADYHNQMGDAHYNHHLGNIILKEGPLKVIKFNEGLTENDAFELEKELIAEFGRYPDGPLVNLSDGGEGSAGVKWPEEARRSRSEQAKAAGQRPPSRKGTTHTVTQETIDKIVAKTKGKRRTPEQCAAQSGRICTIETRAKMRAKKLGTTQSPETIAKRFAKPKRRREEMTLEEIEARKAGARVMWERRRKEGKDKCSDETKALMSRSHNRPETKARKSELAKDQWKRRKQAEQDLQIDNEKPVTQ
jgi:GIY-YIG catalytic domain-containing protein